MRSQVMSPVFSLSCDQDTLFIGTIQCQSDSLSITLDDDPPSAHALTMRSHDLLEVFLVPITQYLGNLNRRGSVCQLMYNLR